MTSAPACLGLQHFVGDVRLVGIDGRGVDRLEIVRGQEFRHHVARQHAVAGVVVDDGDLRLLQIVDHELHGHLDPLAVGVEVAEAERIFHRVDEFLDRTTDQMQLLGARDDAQGGECLAAVDRTAEHVDVLVVDKLLGEADRLGGIGGAVAHDDLDLAAQQAAFLIEVGDRHVEAPVLGLGVRGEHAGDGRDPAHADRLVLRDGRHREGGDKANRSCAGHDLAAPDSSGRDHDLRHTFPPTSILTGALFRAL